MAPLTYLPLLLAFLLLLSHPLSAVNMPSTSRLTRQSDIIGIYELDTQPLDLPIQEGCPPNLTTDSFEFSVSNAPSSGLEGIQRFNIKIPHVLQSAGGRRCESSGAIIAVTSGHPFVEEKDLVVNSWVTAAGGQRAKWVSERFTETLSRETTVWNYGHDFVERSCRGVRIPAGAGYLWFQPSWDVTLLDEEEISPGKVGALLKAGTKYLIITFWNQPRIGCIYKAVSVGGQANMPAGPVADPSLDVIASSPTPEEPTPTPELSKPTDSVEPSTSSIASPLPSPSPSRPSTVFGDAESDPGGAFAGDDGDDSACFPASATLLTDNGNKVRMDQLQVGHRVRVSHHDDLHSDVFFFSHKHSARKMSFIRLTTAYGNVLTVSPRHYIYKHGVMVAAKTVRVGDRLSVRTGYSIVIKVEQVEELGLFAPHTMHGDMIVDGVRVSSYTQTVHPTVAYHLLTPIRALYRLGFVHLVTGFLDHGADLLASFVPSGPDSL